ncbi:type VI secretion system tube protein Hcp [Roseicyclus sp. F158]|uniref:Type VI secretion system tube protein Hcp n=1 Tax=Tropicimonas omnivorans TaxID=3075590 RepID=A0ABU3DE03_9RHOB|nr:MULTISPECIES: type VI secretion system tube protein Hcp [Roseobacteraceae]MDT0681939.1 type VI secretion system tube protein Hcp [Roseicyclus sp. F158]
MAVDMFIKINGIKGEAQDKTHKDEIDVLAWSFGMSNSGSTHIGGGSGAGKANFQDISFTKYIDKSSPILAMHCSNGKHIPDAKLVCRKAGENPLEYLIIDMKDILVSSVSLGGSGGEDRLTENVTLNFGSFKYKYVEQTKTGGSGAQPDMKWDIAANAEGF